MKKKNLIRAINTSTLPKDYIYYLHNFFALEWYQTVLIFDADTAFEMELDFGKNYEIPGIRERKRRHLTSIIHGSCAPFVCFDPKHKFFCVEGTMTRQVRRMYNRSIGIV